MEQAGEREFYFFLAEKLHMTVGELLDRASSVELSEWVAYFRAKAARWEMEARR